MDVAPIVGSIVRDTPDDNQMGGVESSNKIDQSEYADLLDAEEEYDYYGMGDRKANMQIQIMDRQVTPQKQRIVIQQAARSAVAESVMSSPPPTPPLSLIVDFSHYCLHVLIRLMALNPLLREQALSQRQGTQSSAATAAAELQALTSQQQSYSLTMKTPPTFTAILRLLSFLLEHSLLILIEQAEHHIEQLLKIYEEYNYYVLQMKDTSKQLALPARRGPLPFTMNSQQPASASAPAPPHPVLLAAARVHKVCDVYRDRLTVLREELHRYINLRTGVIKARRRSLLHAMNMSSPFADQAQPSPHVSPLSMAASASGVANRLITPNTPFTPTSPQSGASTATPTTSAMVAAASSTASSTATSTPGIHFVLTLRDRLSVLLSQLDAHTEAYNAQKQYQTQT